MMLWDIIRDFFVQYVFGGVTSFGDSFSGYVGAFYCAEADGGIVEDGASTLGLPFNGVSMGGNDYVLTHISLGDWLSTTATIIVLVLLCVCVGLFVRWMFKWIGGCLSRLGR